VEGGRSLDAVVMLWNSNRLAVYNFMDGTWSQQHHVESKYNREWASPWQHQHHMYLFGGLGTNLCLSNDVLRLDVDTMNVEKMDCQGTRPIPRYAACVWTVEEDVVLFGGICEEGNLLNDVHLLRKYSSSERNWQQVQCTGTTPRKRSCVADTRVGNIAYVFGGEGEDYFFNDLHTLNLNTFVWVKVSQKGDVPSVRSGATLTAVDGQNLFLCGGEAEYGATDNISNGCYMYNIMAGVWRRVCVPGFSAPSTHTACHCPVNGVLVFGGYLSDRKDSDRFTQLGKFLFEFE